MSFDGLSKPNGSYNPRERQTLAQVERICASHAFKGCLQLAGLLEFLVGLHYANRYREPYTRGRARPTGTQISNEFYNDRLERFKEDKPKSPAIAGKRLVRRLREKLEEFYGDNPREDVHGPISIEISDERGDAYRPLFNPLNLRITRNRNRSEKLTQVDGANNDSPSRLSGPGRDVGELANTLNSCLGFLNDPQFGREMARYFGFAASHGIYCHDLRTNFAFREVDAKDFPKCQEIKELAPTCFELSIRETVDRVCVPEKVCFAIFLAAGVLAHHFVQPEVDFVWRIDLPDDAVFTGKVSDIFEIDLVEVDRMPVIAGRSKHSDQRINILRDDNEQFCFEVDTSNIPMHGILRKLKYTFHTLKAKDYRFVEYGTRVLTRGMTVKVDFAPDTGVESILVHPSFSGDPSPRPSEFVEGEFSVSGWLLPRSGATFSFRYDKPYR